MSPTRTATKWLMIALAVVLLVVVAFFLMGRPAATHGSAADATDADVGAGMEAAVEAEPAEASVAISTAGKQGAENTADSGAGRLAADGADANAASLDGRMREAWLAFRTRHPGVDPTDDEAFHGAVLDERARLPGELTSAQRDAHGEWLADAEAMRVEMIAARARREGLETQGTTADGRSFALTGFLDGEPVYTYTENREAAISTAASFVRRNSGFDAVHGAGIDGSGFFANINDSGIIAASTEFRNASNTAWRRTNIRGTSVSGHGTHVAGTVGARGAITSAMGMAPAVHLYGFNQQQTSDVLNYGMDWPGRPQRSIVGNTSLGSSSSLNGVYTSTSAAFDSALYDTPYYLNFYSAGNSGPEYFTLTTSRKDGKNLFAVANVNDVFRNSVGVRIGGGEIRESSSRGPTRDGRIKPDIAANGVSVYSPDSDDGYSRRTGTSMASPNAAGSAILLQDYFSKRLGGNLMRASTLMALIINTAEDLGNPGPDYTFGWGLMNTLEAARTIQRHANQPRTRQIREEIIREAETHTFSYQAAGTAPLRATLVWSDPPGPTRTNSSNTDPVLVNDLNLRLIAPDGTPHLPFVMPYVMGAGSTAPFSESLLDAAATTGVNFTDNKIQVMVPAPAAGVWLVEVSHSGTLSGGMQRYSLVVGGLEATDAAAPPVLYAHSNRGTPGEDFALVEILGDGFILGAEVWLRRDGHSPVKAYAVEATGHLIQARVDHSAMAAGDWQLVVRNPDGLETASGTPYQLSSEASPAFFWTGGTDGSGDVMMAAAGYGNWFPVLSTADVAIGSSSRFHFAGRIGGGPGAPIGDGGHLGLNASARARLLFFDNASGHFPPDLLIAANTAATSSRQWTFEEPDTTIIALSPATSGRVTLGHDHNTLGNLGIRLPASGTSTIEVAHPAAILDLSGLRDNTSASVGGVNYGRGAIHAGNADPAAARARLRLVGAGTLDLRTTDAHGNRVSGLTIDGGTVIIGKNPDIAWESLDFMGNHVVINGGTLHFDSFATNTTASRGFQLGGDGGGIRVSGQNHGIAGIIADVPGQAGRLVKTGDAALRPYGDNTYSGGTEVLEGRIRATTTTSLGTGPVTLHTGTSLAAWDGEVTLHNPLIIAGDDTRLGGDGQPVRITGAVDLGGETRTLHVDDDARLDGALANGGLIAIGATAATTLHLGGGLALDGPLGVQSGSLELSGTGSVAQLLVDSDATFRFIAGEPDMESAMLAVAGTVVLDGRLAVAFLDGAVPTTGGTFHLLDAPFGAVSFGDGFSLDLPDLAGDLFWDISDFAATGAVRAITGYALWAETAGLTGDDADPDADPDSDGMSNRLEYLLGYDPLDPASKLRMSLDGTPGDLSVVISRVVPGGVFTIESATDLAGPWLAHDSIHVENPADDFVVPLPVIAESRRFFRLRLSLPETVD